MAVELDAMKKADGPLEISMLVLIDGHCKGTYMVRRAPLFLRAVKSMLLTGQGECDILDQLEDTPEVNERVFVYQRQGEAGWVHLKMGKRQQSGFYALGQYKYLPEVDGEKLRDNEKWRAWVAEQMAALEPGATIGPDGSIQNGRDCRQ